MSLHTFCIGHIPSGLRNMEATQPGGFFSCGWRIGEIFRGLYHPKVVPGKAKRPPGNRVASSLGRIVPTEAKPSELSGEILSLAK